MNGPTIERSELIGLACKAGASVGQWGDAVFTYAELETFYRIAYAAGQDAEREAMKPAIVAACKAHTREMEGYSYFGSNPGVHEDDYEDVANDAAAIRARGQK